MLGRQHVVKFDSEYSTRYVPSKVPTNIVNSPHRSLVKQKLSSSYVAPVSNSQNGLENITFYRETGLRNLGYGQLVMGSNIGHKYKFNQGSLHREEHIDLNRTENPRSLSESKSQSFNDRGTRGALLKDSNYSNSYLSTNPTSKLDSDSDLDNRYSKYSQSPLKSSLHSPTLKLREKQVRNKALHSNNFSLNMQNIGNYSLKKK